MAKHGMTLEEPFGERDRELQKTQHEVQVANEVSLEAQNLALGKSEEARSCLHQLEGVKEQLDFSCEEVISIEAVNVEADVQSKEELAPLQKECN